MSSVTWQDYIGKRLLLRPANIPGAVEAVLLEIAPTSGLLKWDPLGWRAPDEFELIEELPGVTPAALAEEAFSFAENLGGQLSAVIAELDDQLELGNQLSAAAATRTRQMLAEKEQRELLESQHAAAAAELEMKRREVTDLMSRLQTSDTP